MKKRTDIIKIAIDSPAAAGAGTVAKKISSHYNLFYLDTGKIYRYIAKLKKKYPQKFNFQYLKAKIKKLTFKNLNDQDLVSDEIGTLASTIAKEKKIRKIVHSFQIMCAYNPPKKYFGSCLDGRDITYKIIPDADLKFFITANIAERARRRYLELKKKDPHTSYNIVLKSIKKRDKSDKMRKSSPLKRTKDSILINTSNLSKRACFLKIKNIIDRKLKN